MLFKIEAEMGVGMGGLSPRGFWNYSQKKGIFSISRGIKQISPLLAPLWKKHWEIPYWPPLEKILQTPMEADLLRCQPKCCRRM